VGGDGTVRLSWTAATGAQTYNVYRGTSSGGEGGTPLATGLTGTTYTDTGVSAGGTYYYTVTAVNANANAVPPLPAESAASGEASAVSFVSPTGLTASANAVNTNVGQVALSWNAFPGATGYNVYRSTTTNGEGGTPLAVNVSSPSFTDTTAGFGTTWFYKVTAVTSSGETPPSGEASAMPLLQAHVHFTTRKGAAVAGYLADVGLAYGNRVNGLVFGWNRNTAGNARDRNAANSPDELHDSFNFTLPSIGATRWYIAVPNGTYSVHLIVGDPSNVAALYRFNVGGIRKGATMIGATLAINGKPTTSNRWLENTVIVTVTGGVLYVTNAAGARNNKIDAIDITQLPPGVNDPGGFAGATGLQRNGSAQVVGSALRLTDGGAGEAGSVFTTTTFDVTRFSTAFDFLLTSAGADGFTFTIQGGAATALGNSGGDLGYAGIGNSVAVKFDLYDNNGEGVNSTGLYLNGVAPTGAGSVDLTGTGIDLHSDHPFHAALSYDGVTLSLTLTDRTTSASFTRAFAVNIAQAVGGTRAHVGFTGATGGATAIQDILDWTYHPGP
jgi:hypothetical protein